MNEVNIFCDTCGLSASTFGFTKPGHKYKVCKDHIQDLTDKHLTTFDIAAFNFIDSVQDAGLFEERRELRRKGLGNIAALESEGDGKWAESCQSLETGKAELMGIVETCYREKWQAAHSNYEQAKQALEQRKLNFERLLISKQYQLSAEDAALCESLTSARNKIPPAISKELAVLGVPTAEILLGKLKTAGKETALQVSEHCPQLLVALDALLRSSSAQQTGNEAQLLSSVQGRKLYIGLSVQQWPCSYCHTPTEAGLLYSMGEFCMCHDCYRKQCQAEVVKQPNLSSKTCEQCWAASPIDVPDSALRIWHCPHCLSPVLLNSP